MKKLLFILLAFTTITLNAQKTVISKVTDTIDSVKQTTANTVNFVDTSSTFKTIYKDVKEGISGLASALKVGAEHVYVVLVKQQVVNSVSWLIYIIISIIISFFAYKLGAKLINYCDDSNPAPTFYCMFVGIGCTLLIINGLWHIDTIVMGFINPEYGAIMDIINFVKH